MTEIDLTEDADERRPIDTTDAAQIGILCEEYLKLEREITILEERIAKRKERMSRLELEFIPESMRAANTSEFKLYDGSKVEVKPFIKLGIVEEKKPEAFKWFRANNFGDIIKRNVSVALGKGQDKVATEVFDILTKMKLNPVDQENVHWQTLQAFGKEQLAKGVQFPEEIFSVFSGMKAKIKVPKDK